MVDRLGEPGEAGQTVVGGDRELRQVRATAQVVDEGVLRDTERGSAERALAVVGELLWSHVPVRVGEHRMERRLDEPVLQGEPGDLARRAEELRHGRPSLRERRSPGAVRPTSA